MAYGATIVQAKPSVTKQACVVQSDGQVMGATVEDIRNLDNKPLVEALFEVRWVLSGSPGGAVDPGYPLLIGQLYGKLRDQFPCSVRLPLSEVPTYLVPFTPQHQFRVAADRWPLVQLGAGLLTVNDTEGYLWDDFLKNCSLAIDSLFDVYPQDTAPLRIAEVSLRYIDADLLENLSSLEFLKKLKINIDVSPELFKNSIISQRAVGASLSLVFPLSEPRGILQFAANQGRKGNADALVWETQVLSRGNDCPQTAQDISAWLRKAHDVTHEWFIKQVEGELLEKYR